MIIIIKKSLKILDIIWREFCYCDCLNKAASLAYSTLLSLVPLLAISFSVLTFFSIFDKLKQKVEAIIIENFITASAQTIQKYVYIFINQTSKLSIIGAGFLLITAVLLIFNTEKIFNTIWHVRHNRNGITAFFVYWAIIILIPIIIALVVFVINHMPWIAIHKASFFRTFFSLFLSHFGFFVTFFLLYVSVPNCKVPILSATFSALITTILFELVRSGFTLYIKYIANYDIIYGAAASVPIFLIWLYISWILILLGVVINYVLANLHKLNYLKQVLSTEIKKDYVVKNTQTRL